MNYYNENDPKAAAWLRELIRAGLIADGIVDERSIADVQPADLTAYTQCHFFAGIGGWAYALRLAGWPDDRPVWTGSCPCQPFSVAGKGKGEEDERHLWPEFKRLIDGGKPAIVFGEQVASAAGRLWLDGVRTDLETLGYEVGAADLCAAGVGAPHIRQRLFWMAHAECHSGRARRIADESRESFGTESAGAHAESGRCGMSGRLADVFESGLERHAGNGDLGNEPGRIAADAAGSIAARGRFGSWSDCDLIPCRDGKARRIESGTFPLAHGVSGRVGLLRGYGNAIVPQEAAEFILACEEAIQQLNKPI